MNICTYVRTYIWLYIQIQKCWKAHLRPSRLEQEASTAFAFPDLFVKLQARHPHTTIPVLIRVQLHIAAQDTFNAERTRDQHYVRFVQSCMWHTPTTVNAYVRTYIPNDGVEYLEGCFGFNDVTALSQPLHGLVEGGDVPHQPQRLRGRRSTLHVSTTAYCSEHPLDTPQTGQICTECLHMYILYVHMYICVRSHNGIREVITCTR